MDQAETTSSQLSVLRDEIAGRVSLITAEFEGWPCRRGCDHCCRHLACLPELVEVEWHDIETGIAALPPESRLQVETNLAELNHGARAPYACPLLDRQTGACHVYSHRPVACRTYGFYVQRGVGSYCSIIRDRVENGAYAQVVWGNHEAVDRHLDRFGPRIPMRDWLQRRVAMR